MICIECGEPVSSLYTTYPNGHIKLTDCASCHQVCDKYVEFDNVLLFIDVLLLKGQVFRHLVFNSIGLDKGMSTARKIRLVSVLFEIYITWAYEERKGLGGIKDFSIYNEVLAKDAVTQYLYFGVQCFSDDLLTHWLLQWLTCTLFKWTPRDSTTPGTAISMTLVIFSGVRLFPLLMLIWPYDSSQLDPTTMSITMKLCTNVALVEALRLITQFPLWKPIVMFAILTVCKLLTRTALIALLLSHGDYTSFVTIVSRQWRALQS